MSESSEPRDQEQSTHPSETFDASDDNGQAKESAPAHPSDEDEGYRRAPDDFEAEFSVEDQTVPNHPVIVNVPGKGEASAYLVKQRVLDDLRDEQAEGNEAGNFDDKALVDIIKRHYVSPSFDGLTVKKYKDSPAGYYDRYFEAIVPELGNR